MAELREGGTTLADRSAAVLERHKSEIKRSAQQGTVGQYVRGGVLQIGHAYLRKGVRLLED